MLTGATSGENFAFVKDSLFKFITARIPNADLSVIDDILLSYVYTSFEGGVEEFYSQLNDVVSDFADMMEAYIADFSKIERSEVCCWMINIVDYLDQMATAKARKARENEARTLNLLPTIADAAPAPEKPKKGKSRTNSTSEDEKENGDSLLSVFYEDELCYVKCTQIHEMFPGTNPMEVKHCMSIAFGHMDDAVSALMNRRDCGQSMESSSWQVAAKVETVDDDEIKHRIIARYSYVDKQSETKEHKPLAPKHEPKKMVRYRDNKIVSLKGERFTEVPKSDEDGVKKASKKHNP